MSSKEDIDTFGPFIVEHDAKIRKDEREKIREHLSHISDEDCAGEMNSDECLSYEANCTLCKFDHVVESLSATVNK